MSTVRFFVPGLPRPGGSKKGFVNPRTGRVIITEDCKRSKDWRTAVAFMAAEQFKVPLQGALQVHFEFLVPRPKGHFRTGRNAGRIKASAPLYPAVRPDVTKLIRSTEDSMKGIAWHDDSQIVRQFGEKAYAEQAGVWIEIFTLEDGSAEQVSLGRDSLPFEEVAS